MNGRTADSREQYASSWEEYPSPVWVRVADPVPDRNNFMGKADAFMRGVADALTLGTADEIAAALKSGSIFGLNEGLWGDYDHQLARERAIDADDERDRYVYRLPGQLAGGVTSASGLGRLGLSAVPKLADRGIIGRVVGGVIDGLGQGAVYGFNSGEGGFDSRADRIPGEALSSAFVGALGGAPGARAAPRQVPGKTAAFPASPDPTAPPVTANRVSVPTVGDFTKEMIKDYILDDIKRSLKDPYHYIDREAPSVFPDGDIGESWAPSNRGDRLVPHGSQNLSHASEKRKLVAPMPGADWPWRLSVGNPGPERFLPANLPSVPPNRFHPFPFEPDRMEARFGPGKPASTSPLGETQRAAFVQAAQRRGDLPAERATRILQELMVGAQPPHPSKREPLELTIRPRSRNF